jgi:hypothetical protein
LQRANFGRVDAAEAVLNDWFIPGMRLPGRDWHGLAEQAVATMVLVASKRGPSQMVIYRSGFFGLCEQGRAKISIHTGSTPQLPDSSYNQMGLESRPSLFPPGPKFHCRSENRCETSIPKLETNGLTNV